MKKTNLKKTAIYLSLLLTFVLTLSACTNQASETKTPSNNDVKKPATEKPVDTESPEDQANDASNSEKSITKQDVANLIINSEFDSPDFLRNVELAIQDLEMQTVLQEANKEKDIALCQKISRKDLKENCENTFYYQQAFEDKNIELCKKISTEYQQKDCINQTNYNLAIEKMDENLCNEITEEYQQKDCKNSVAYTKARNDLDPTLCNKIENEETAKMCQEDIKMIIEMNRENEERNNQPEPIIENEIPTEPIPEDETTEVAPDVIYEDENVDLELDADLELELTPTE